mmetsp:Transcript_55250/g.160398  ORF Transcript_55250/g.160398 Transcript_55250/m.160398 type:complete len:216 (+) Transcript_55250:41-688(+)
MMPTLWQVQQKWSTIQPYCPGGTMPAGSTMWASLAQVEPPPLQGSPLHEMQSFASEMAEAQYKAFRAMRKYAKSRSFRVTGWRGWEKHIETTGLLFRKKHQRSFRQSPYQRILFATKSCRSLSSASVYFSSTLWAIIDHSCLINLDDFEWFTSISRSSTSGSPEGRPKIERYVPTCIGSGPRRLLDSEDDVDIDRSSGPNGAPPAAPVGGIGALQ